MRKFKWTTGKIAFSSMLVLGALASISWTGTLVHTTGINYDIYAADTIPEKKLSLEDQIQEIRKAQENLQRELSQKDWTKIEAEMENALSRINTKEIDAQMQKAMAEFDRSIARIDKEQLLRQVDMEKLQADMAKVQLEIEKEFSSRDWKKEMKTAQLEMEKALKEIKSIDPAQLKEELAKAKIEMKLSQEKLALELDRAKKEMKDNKISIKQSLEDARKDLEKTRKEYEGYRTMIGEMQQEGLIPDPKNYQIEFKGGEIYVNGVKQPATITSRYRKYFSDKPILLKNSDNKFETED